MRKSIESAFHSIQNTLFSAITGNRLVYNSCWEDPRIDRELLQLNRNSKVVMLSSAGDNALDYVLDDAASIHCVDINPAQNALVEFKKALFLWGDDTLLWQLFGSGHSDDITPFFNNVLQTQLPSYAAKFWATHLHYFSKTVTSPGFYVHGTAGRLAQTVRQQLRQKRLYSTAVQMLNAQTLDQQAAHFNEICPQLFTPFVRWMLRRSPIMAMLGVPRAQQQLIKNDGHGGLPAFIEQSMEHVFTKRPIRDNYFWRVYITGRYTRDCCPNYLKATNFQYLKKRMSRLHIHNQTLASFLQQYNTKFSHFVLLDHQDWMAAYHTETLLREWTLILKRAQPGAKILFRSAAPGRSFIPTEIQSHLFFDDDTTIALHSNDRVGTYGSTHLAIVR